MRAARDKPCGPRLSARSLQRVRIKSPSGLGLRCPCSGRAAGIASANASKFLDQAGIDQQAIEPPRLGAIAAAIK